MPVVTRSDTKLNLENEITEALNIKELPAKPKQKMALIAALAMIFTVLSVSFTWIAVEIQLGASAMENLSLTSRGIKTTALEYAEGWANARQDMALLDANHPELREGKKLLDEKRFTEAIAFFEKMLKKDPSIKDKITTPYSVALRKQAAKLVDRNEPEKAKLLLLKIEGTNSEDALGHYMLGRIYADEKDYLNAISAYEMAVEITKIWHGPILIWVISIMS